MPQYVVSLEEASLFLGASPQAVYISDHLKLLSAKTLLIEYDYIDKDYIIDYSKFFSRSHQGFRRLTDRLHFFSIPFSQEKFEAELNKSIEIESSDFISELRNGYLGFVVLKPILDGENSCLIGRTLLKPNDKPENIYTHKKFIRKYNKINLYGIPLIIEALPFQEQDSAVSACATIALWITNNKLNDLFGTPQLSPYEVTEIATNCVEKSRNFPNEGLTVDQMLTFLRIIKLDCDIINLSYLNSIISDEDFSSEVRATHKNMLHSIVLDAIKAFIDANIPIIAGIKLYEFDGKGLIVDREVHAVVISGYSQDENGIIDKIFVHDDQIGPYSTVISASQDCPFLEWKGALQDSYNINKIELDFLIIPIYPKIRLAFRKIHGLAQEKRDDFPAFTIKVRLANIQDYKQEILSFSLKNKSDFLKCSLPRFIWILSVYSKDLAIYDLIYDATSHYIRHLGTIDLYKSYLYLS